MASDRNRRSHLAGRANLVEIPIEDFASYRSVGTFTELCGPGSRILRFPSERAPQAALVIAAGEPRRRIGSAPTIPIELRCAKVARALCLTGGVIIDLETGRLLPDAIRRPPRALPPAVDVDPSKLGLDGPVTDWDQIPARELGGPGYYADSRFIGYGHVLLEALSRCWALADFQTRLGVVVAHKAARSTYLPWFDALGIGEDLLHSTKKGPLRIDNLIVPSQSYVLDRGMSPRFYDMTRRVARQMGSPGECPRLFVSRRDAPKRRLVNEAEIEATFSANSFRIFHPAEHTLDEQVRAFAGASLVAGPVGSGLYSLAFSPPHTQLIVLAPREFYTINDRILAGLRDQPPVFAFGDAGGLEGWRARCTDWYLDPEYASAAIEQVLTEASPT